MVRSGREPDERAEQHKGEHEHLLAEDAAEEPGFHGIHLPPPFFRASGLNSISSTKLTAPSRVRMSRASAEAIPDRAFRPEVYLPTSSAFWACASTSSLS